MTQDAVFRFVVVRPAQRLDHDSPARKGRFARPTEHSQLERSLQGVLARTDGRQLAHELATHYAESGDYVAVLGGEDVLDTLGEVADLLDADPVDVGAIRAAVAGAVDAYVDGEPFRHAERRLWDSLYSATVTGAAPDPVIRGLRATHALRIASASDDLADGDALRLARPVVPSALMTPRSDHGELLAAADGIEGDQSRGDVTDEIRRLRGALEEVNRVHARVIVAPGAEAAHEVALRADDGDVASYRVPSVPGTDERSAILLRSEDCADISDETRATLETIGMDPTRHTATDLVESIERRLREAVRALAPSATGVSVVGGTVIASGRHASVAAVDESGELPRTPGLSPVKTLDGTGSSTAPHARLLERRTGGRATSATPPPLVDVLVGDLKLVRKSLPRYEPGEIAHIENVLQSEHKERVHRRLSRTEESLSVEEEQIRETEQDLQTSDRFELERESEETIQSDASGEVGATVTGRYGAVTSTVTASGSMSRSREQARSVASDYAQDVTQRSVRRIQERVAEQRIRKTLQEVEETSTHGFDNRDGDGHVVGVYRWVDKTYEAQLVNYGRRMMLHVVVPEPAAYFVHTQTNRPIEGLEPPQPLDGLQPEDLQPWNYQAWIAAYGVEGVEPPPPRYRRVGVSFSGPAPADEAVSVEGTIFDSVTPEPLEVPDGYRVRAATVWHSDVTLPGAYVRVHVGQRIFDSRNDVFRKTMNNEDDVVPVTVHSLNALSFTGTVQLECERSGERLARWQLDTYTAIVQAYRAQRTQYDEKLAAAMTRRGVGVLGRNPARNRQIEHRELQRMCVRYLAGEQFLGSFDAMRHDATGQLPPGMSVGEAAEESPWIRFFDEAFEWKQMTYQFQPYYWSNQPRWAERLGLSDVDPQFESFLHAGAARVLLPVRPERRDDVLHYLATGRIWKGTEPPAVSDDDELLALLTDLQGAPDDEAVAEGEPWRVRVPTSLVILQQEPGLPPPEG